MSRIANSSYKVNAGLEQIVEISNTTIPTSENIAKWGGTVTTLGQKVMASSVPVVVSSDQSELDFDLTKVGAAAISLGQKAKATSLPVTLASDEDALAVTLTNAVNSGSAGNLSAAQSAAAGAFSTEVDVRLAKNISITGSTSDTSQAAIELYAAVTSGGTKFKISFDIFPATAGGFSQDLSGVAYNFLSLKYTIASTVTAQAIFN